MRISVIIPTYNRRESLLRCLDELGAQTLSSEEFEVLVVVDGSTDGTAEAARQRRLPYALTVVEQANSGPAAARNSGAAKACGEYLAFTEDDVLPDKDWLARASEHLRANPSIDILEGRTVSMADRADIRRRDLPGVPSFIPCNLFIRKPTFAASAGYDPMFYDGSRHIYFREDADLGFSLMDSGARVFLARDVIVAHPVQFSGVGDAIRHARRFVFDPLLYRKHPRRFRLMIEQKSIAGIRLRRVHHIVALMFGVTLFGLVAGALNLVRIGSLDAIVVLLLCVLFFKYKYQGARGFLSGQILDLPAFTLVPCVYLASVLRGCIRFRSIGALLP